MFILDDVFVDGWVGGDDPTGPVTPPGRPVVAESAGLGFSAHSFLQQAVAPGDFGDLGAYRSGALHINYLEFSSLKQRWDANGVDRTATYDGALVLTEIGDLATGLADPASAQGIETLQHLYWYALTAQAKGCRLLGIYPPHSPEGADLDADAMAKVQYWIDWLRARPEITIPVHAIPVPQMVRAMIERFGPQVVPPYLNDPAATVRGMVVNSVSADALSFTSDGSDTRRAYTFPAPPAGSTVEFDITCSNFVWFRLSDDNGLEPPNEIDLVAAMGAGTRHVSVTIPAYTAQDRLGFLVAENGVNVQITNWRVRSPGQSIYADGLHLKTDVYGAPNQMNNAMGQMVRMFLTGQRPANDPGWNAELVGLVDTAWQLVQDYEITGLGGATVVAPYPVASDPLPSPAPLP